MPILYSSTAPKTRYNFQMFSYIFISMLLIDDVYISTFSSKKSKNEIGIKGSRHNLVDGGWKWNNCPSHLESFKSDLNLLRAAKFCHSGVELMYFITVKWLVICEVVRVRSGNSHYWFKITLFCTLSIVNLRTNWSV